MSSSSYYGSSGSSSSKSSMTMGPSTLYNYLVNSPSGSIVNTRVTNRSRYTTPQENTKPLRLPKKPNFFSRSKLSNVETSYSAAATQINSYTSSSSSRSSNCSTNSKCCGNCDLDLANIGPSDDQSSNLPCSPQQPVEPPPPIKPYVYRSTNNNRHEKNLLGSSCCFCEEPLEHTLAGEKVVTLLCGHVSHYECLFHMVDIDITSSSSPNSRENYSQNDHNGEKAGFPFCPTCDYIAQPINRNLGHEMIKKKLLSHTNTMSPEALAPRNYSRPLGSEPKPIPLSLSKSPSSTVASSSTTSSPHSPPQAPCTPEMQSQQSLLYIDTPESSLASEHSQIAKESITPLKLAYSENHYSGKSYNMVGSMPTEQRQFQSLSLTMPTVDIIPETDAVQLADNSDKYISYLVSVSVPGNIFSSRARSTEYELEQLHIAAMRLKGSIHDWKRLDFKLFGRLRIYGSFYMSRDMASWQEVTCYLFDTMLLCVRDYSYDINGSKLGKSAYIKATVNLKRDLETAVMDQKTILTLNLDTQSASLPSSIYISSQHYQQVEAWYAGLIDPELQLPIDYSQQPRDKQQHHFSASSPLYSPLSPQNGLPKLPIARAPIDSVIAIPGSGVPNEHKWSAIKQTIRRVLSQMGCLDRMGLIIYGPESYAVPLARNTSDWSELLDSLRPLGNSSSCGMGNDLIEAVGNSMKLLESRKSSNPVTSIYLISDSNSQLGDTKLYESIVQECAESNISLHAFGVSFNHDPDVLTRSSVTTGGTYFYVKEWKQLMGCVIGRLIVDQSYTHRNVEVRLDTEEFVRVTSINGCDNTVNTDILNNYDGTRASSQPIRSFQPLKLKKIPLGSLAAGQTRSFLVQISVPPKQVLGRKSSEGSLQLFKTKLTYSGFKGINDAITERSVGTAVIKIETPSRSPILSSAMALPPKHITAKEFSWQDVDVMLSPSLAVPPPRPSLYSTAASPPGSPSNCEMPPSPICGNFLLSDEVSLPAPVFLAVQKHNAHVVRRRLQLVAARNFESAIQHMSHNEEEKAYRVMVESRPILKGLLEICTSSSATGLGCLQDDLYLETKAIVKILDRDVAIVAETFKKPVLFAQDGRKWVIQTIGILRSQMAFTSRSDIENLFFQCHQRMNVL